MSNKFILCVQVRNSHDHSILQSINTTRGNLMLVTLLASKRLIRKENANEINVK